MAGVAFLVLMVLTMPARGAAQQAEQENILIRNVRLIAREGQTED